VVVVLCCVVRGAHLGTRSYKLRALGHCIFVDLKESLLQAAINKTWTEGGTTLSITLSNPTHLEWVDKARIDAAARNPAVSKCLFVQVFDALHQKQTRLLRARLNNRGLLFQVSFRGEEGRDWGGLYRDCLTRVAEDLFSSYLDLFIPCPNAVAHNVCARLVLFLGCCCCLCCRCCRCCCAVLFMPLLWLLC